MNLKSNKKSKFWCIPYVMLTLLAFFLGSCDDGKEVSPITGSGGTPFNPAFPIRIDSIYPKAGSAGQRVLIYGENLYWWSEKLGCKCKVYIYVLSYAIKSL